MRIKWYHFVSILGGALFTIFSAILVVDAPRAFTASALIGITMIKLLVSLVTISLLVLVISALRKNIRLLWFPIFAWLFLIIGLGDFSVSAYNHYVLKPRLISKLAKLTVDGSLPSQIEPKVNSTEHALPRDLFAENPDILYNMAFQYMRGDGAPQNHAKAMEYLIEAANNGHAEAQYNLGAMYLNGVGVPQDTEKALFWLTEARINGNSGATDLLKKIEVIAE